jgi:hypothetical protein
MSVAEATEQSITAAHFEAIDQGAVEALRVIARKIDQLDPESRDNVLLPTYLKYCTELGLTPAGRKAAPKVEGEKREPSSIAQRRANRLRSA